MPTTTVSALLRAEQAYVAQLADAESLDHGIAFVARRFKSLDDANQFREVVIATSDEIRAVFMAVEDHFSKQGACCRVWAPAADAPIDAIDSCLRQNGFTPRHFHALRVGDWLDLPTPDGLRVLPARAMRKAFDAVLLRRFNDPANPANPERIAAAIERLNDPRTDAWVAVRDGHAAGYCTLFQVGDVARLSDVYVVDESRRTGIATAMIGHALRLARRLMFRVVATRAPIDDAAAAALLARCGFTADGAVTEFVRTRE
ncbi:MAG: GNAT family N-acetyltransferase [Phycisphaerales bacterium]|nr:GNAT family N-acetyltransferase [Phycisphaerales bacterium]